MPNPEKLLFAAALGLAALGVGVAVVQPGDLGDGTEEAATTIPVTTPTSTSTSTSTSPSTSTTPEAIEAPTTVVASSTQTVPTSTTVVTSAPTTAPMTATEPDLADTGGASLLGPAAAAVVTGLALRRRRLG